MPYDAGLIENRNSITFCSHARIMTNASEQERIDRALAAINGEGGRLLIAFLQNQRWFGGKGKPLAAVRLSDAIELPSASVPYLLAVLLVEYRGGSQERYMMPLSIRSKVGSVDLAAIAELPGSSGQHWVCDATMADDVWRSLHDLVATEKERGGRTGSVRGRALVDREGGLAGPFTTIKILSGEQSNTSIVFDRRVIMKLIRKVELGISPEREMLEFLTTKALCLDVPPLLGYLTYQTEQEGAIEEDPEGTVVVLQRFVVNRGDGWSYSLSCLGELLRESRQAAQTQASHPSQVCENRTDAFLKEIHQLGEVTGNLHLALASDGESGPFCPEPITMSDVTRWQGRMQQFLAEVCRDLRSMSPEQQTAAGFVSDEATTLELACRDRFNDLARLVTGQTVKIRHHGDYHLGQVLKTEDGFAVIDFEGEPARSLEERRAKVCPLKDVAGMLRSFSYAAQAVLQPHRPISPDDQTIMTEWEHAARQTFLNGYRSVVQPGAALFLPATWDDTLRVLQVYELDKALYELRYELRNRPEWLAIPLQGIRSLTQKACE